MKNIKWNKVRVRISDNVLSNKEWTVYDLTFKGNDVPRVDSQTTVNEGVYGDDFIGMSTVDLHKWNKYDSTGEHPETYHEVYDRRKGKFTDFLSVIDIKQLVEGDFSGEDTVRRGR